MVVRDIEHGGMVVAAVVNNSANSWLLAPPDKTEEDVDMSNQTGMPYDPRGWPHTPQ